MFTFFIWFAFTLLKYANGIECELKSLLYSHLQVLGHFQNHQLCTQFYLTLPCKSKTHLFQNVLFRHIHKGYIDPHKIYTKEGRELTYIFMSASNRLKREKRWYLLFVETSLIWDQLPVVTPSTERFSQIWEVIIPYNLYTFTMIHVSKLQPFCK